MLSTIQWVYLFAILFAAFAGGYLPLTRREQSRGAEGFPKGEAFSSGVFLALSLTMLLPSAFLGFRQALPEVEYPIASVIAIVAFLILLAVEHVTRNLVARSLPRSETAPIPALIPLVTTGMIAAPSFFLGAALAVSDRVAAALIFMAAILHKGSAAFALALTMTRSTLTRRQSWALFTCFALMTPLGIVCGGLVREDAIGSASLFKAAVLAVGAGAFLYMGTLHEMQRASLITHCCRIGCFLCMLAGMGVTVLVRWIVGEAHRF